MKLFTGYQLLAPDLSEDIALRKSLEFETNDFLAARTKDVYVLNVGNMLNVMLEARQQQLKHLQTREQVNETRLETQTNLDYAASSPRRDSNSQALLPTLHNDTSYDHNPHVTKEDVDDYARLDIKCNYCNERPEGGYRDTDELDRHVARAHASRRKGYICFDSSKDKKFLADCKHCRNKKVYGTYYNAAAHLRRAHFRRQKWGKNGNNDEKRGGIGGGDDPPMEHLKQHWIKEVEVDNNNPRHHHTYQQPSTGKK
jgi:hypothetical protein